MSDKFDTTDFSIGNYFHLLQALSNRGYATVNFMEADHRQLHLILRHDIDFDLEAAVTFARAEERHGYSSTYFVMLTSEFYNPISAKGRQALASIMSCGHEIGLHFDASIYQDDAAALTEVAKTECLILEQITGQTTRVLSMHRPSAALVDKDLKFAGCLNAYAPHFTKAMGYCSDSSGTWRFGSPLESEAYKIGKSLQLLTHPIWWLQEEPASPQNAVENFLLKRQRILGQEAERNCTAYADAKNTLPI